mgnify:CR=1 FL=1
MEMVMKTFTAYAASICQSLALGVYKEEIIVWHYKYLCEYQKAQTNYVEE